MAVLVPLGAAISVVIFLVVVSLQLTPKGWSRDIVFDDGQMKIRVQYKVELDPTDVGKVNLMVKIKNSGGYLMYVDHVHFSVTESGQKVVDLLEGAPMGTFAIGSDSFYMATLELPPAKTYQAGLEVAHRQSSFTLQFPFEVKAMQ